MPPGLELRDNHKDVLEYNICIHVHSYVMLVFYI